jgi:hypothetical protein
MKIKFSQDYVGRETAMRQYRKGDTGDLPTAQALDLIRMGVAKEESTFDPLPTFGGLTAKPRRKKAGDE